MHNYTNYQHDRNYNYHVYYTITFYNCNHIYADN